MPYQDCSIIPCNLQCDITAVKFIDQQSDVNQGQSENYNGVYQLYSLLFKSIFDSLAHQ